MLQMEKDTLKHIIASVLVSAVRYQMFSQIQVKFILLVTKK